MPRQINCWLDKDWFDELAEYYNEHHDEIREKNIRNFGHWIGALAISNLRSFNKTVDKNVKKR